MIKFNARVITLAVATVFAGSAMANFPFSWTEDFEGIGNLQQPVDEAGRGYDEQNVWSRDPDRLIGDGWNFDNSGVPQSSGAEEWRGWTVANYEFWRDVAGDQDRSEFTNASGNVLVADPDEFDDYNGGIGDDYFDAYATTGAIDINNVIENTLNLKFDSSWRPECCDDYLDANNQTAVLEVSFDMGSTWVEVDRWDSDFLSDIFKADETNATLDYDLTDKAARYAAEGVEELWVADNEGRVLHVFRDASAGAWSTRQALSPDDAVSPLCLPTLRLRVADLFPPAE
ncbi:MAG: Uma2 family endonuclease [Fimbriimonadaceae bacterium]